MGFPVSLIWAVEHIKANLPYRLCADRRTELSWTDREVSKCSGNKNTLDTQTETDKTEKKPKKSVGPEDSLKQTGNNFCFGQTKSFFFIGGLRCSYQLLLPNWLGFSSVSDEHLCIWKELALYDFSIWVFLLIGLFHLLLLVEFQFGLRLKFNASMRLYPHQLWGDDEKPWLIPILWSSVSCTLKE